MVLKVIPTPENRYVAKWRIVGVDHERFKVVKQPSLSLGTIGLYLQEGVAYRTTNSDNRIPMTELLVGDQKLWFVTSQLALMTTEDIETLRNGSES